MSSLFRDTARIFPLLLGASLLMAVSPAPLRAEELLLAPALSLRGEYNDNVLAQVSDRRADYVASVSPSLSLSRSSETAALRATVGVNALRYLRDTVESDLGYFVRGNGSAQATQRLLLAADLDFSRDPSASYLDPATSQLVGSRSERQACRAGVKYRLSELVRASVDAAYSRYDYENPSYRDTSYYQGSLALEYQLGEGGEGTWLTPQLAYRRDETDLSRVENVTLSVGLSRQLTETLGAALSAGGRYTRSELETAAGTGSAATTDRGGVGRGMLTWSGSTGSATVLLSHTLAPASGQSGARQISEASLSLSRRFTSRLSGDLAAGYTRSWSGADDFASRAVDERARNAGAALKYRVLESPRDLSLEARYGYHSTKYRTIGAEMRRNVVSLELTWQQDLLR